MQGPILTSHLRDVLGLVVSDPMPTPAIAADPWQQRDYNRRLSTLRKGFRSYRRRVNRQAGPERQIRLKKAPAETLDLLIAELNLCGWNADWYVSDRDNVPTVMFLAYYLSLRHRAEHPFAEDDTRLLITCLSGQPLRWPEHRDKQQQKLHADRVKALHRDLMALRERVMIAIKCQVNIVPVGNVNPEAVRLMFHELTVFEWPVAVIGTDLTFL